MRVFVGCALPYLKLSGLAVSLLPILVQRLVCLMVLLGVILHFCVVWFRFRMLRRYLAYWPGEVPAVFRLLDSAAEGCPGRGLAHLLAESATGIGFQWDSRQLGWERLGLPVLSNLAGPFQHYRTAVPEAWRGKDAADLCVRKGFSGEALGWIVMVPCSFLTLTMFGREIRLCSGVSLLGEFEMAFCWER